MRIARLLTITIMIVLLALSAQAQGDGDSTTPEPTEGTETYVVQPGDNLFRIAQRFGVTQDALAQANGIENASQIFAGQELIIPVEGADVQPADPTPTPEPTETVAPSFEGTYTVQPGDTLNLIAQNLGVSVEALSAANDITNPSLIFSGQVLNVPGEPQAAPTEAAPSADDEEAEPLGETTTQTSEIDPGFGYGIEVFTVDQDVDALVQQVSTLGMGWVKLRADWRMLEPEPGQIDFMALDGSVDAFDAAGFNILLTVTNAPTWARSSRDENGPPDDLANFASFMTALANQYAGRVDAYEIWDEPNLRRNWNCERRMCDTDYVEIVRLAFDAIKTADPAALVVTAGLAPTRFNDRINAINDQLFLQTMYANGIAAVSDAIGAHPGGWANPPDAVCCSPTEGVETHFENDSFYFLDNVRAYRQIMIDAGDQNTPLWLTKFGWGTSEDTDPPGEIHIFVTYTSLAEQAIYIPRAFELGQELGYVGPMFLDNLNGCQGMPTRAEACYNSMVAPDGSTRIAFNAVQAVEKPTTVEAAAADETIDASTDATEEAANPIEPVGVESALPEATPQVTEESADSP